METNSKYGVVIVCMGRGVKATPQLFAVFFSLSDIREALKKKSRDYLGIFPKRRTPTPPFGNFDHFLPYYFGQVGNFWVILRCFKGIFRAMVK